MFKRFEKETEHERRESKLLKGKSENREWTPRPNLSLTERCAKQEIRIGFHRPELKQHEISNR